MEEKELRKIMENPREREIYLQQIANPREKKRIVGNTCAYFRREALDQKLISNTELYSTPFILIGTIVYGIVCNNSLAYEVGILASIPLAADEIRRRLNSRRLSRVSDWLQRLYQSIEV